MTRLILAINFCPLCQQPVKQSAVLAISKPKARWTLHCQAGPWLHITGTDGLTRVIYMMAAPPVKPKPGELDDCWDYVSGLGIISRDVIV